jgi:Raf kinase inhibitor-like YbhB/YbcL family protein
MEGVKGTLMLTSTAFAEGGAIPSRYTCDASMPTNPPLAISGVPEGTKSLTLIVDDPDVPKRLKPDGVFDHWVLFNIPPDVVTIGEGDAPGTSGMSGTGQGEYVPPCPPPQYEPSEHRYVFTLYALDAELNIPEGASKQDVLKAMEGHVLDEAKLVGRYRRQ